MRLPCVPQVGYLLMLILWLKGITSRAQGRAKSIGCDTSASSSGCGFETICWVTCPPSCGTEVQLYGTGTYTYDSPICVAAVHDTRLSPWNRTTHTVAFKRESDTEDYRGSRRNGVTSKSYGRRLFGLQGSYHFVSPRIEEPIIDVTSAHVRYRFKSTDSNHTQMCFAPPGGTVEFSRFTWDTSSDRASIQKPYEGVFKAVWPAVGSGAFVCSVRGSVLSTVTSLAFQRYFDFPTILSQTINANDNAAIKNSYGGSATWYKDRAPPRDGTVRDRNSRVEINNAQLGDAGLYSFKAQPATPFQVSRLIVRACSKGRYGHNCRERCPECLNGGVCHDITGICICPPGFTGNHCELNCRGNSFGKNCTHNCSEVAALSGVEAHCGGVLFCLPDPYGCSCYPGFMGIDCIQPCRVGSYGADCKQKRICHCHNGQGCHPQWGVCPDNDCEEGYRDAPFCDKVYPVLSTFFVRSLDEENIEVTWSPWSHLNGDSGEGDPDGYVIQFKELSAEYWNKTDVIQDTGNEKLEFVLTEVRPNTAYQVQVLVHDRSGHVHSQTAKKSTVRTPCGAPLIPPHNFSHEEMADRRVTLMWQLPGQSQWQCDTVETVLKINNAEPHFARDHSYTFPTTPYTRYTVQARLVVNREKAGPWSDVYDFTTREAAPDEVGSLSVERLSAKKYLLRWQPPTVTNGILRWYHMVVDVVALNKITCPDFQPGERLNLSYPGNVTSDVLENFTAAAEYRISILATTVEDGPWKSFKFLTREEVPERPPRQLEIVRWSDRSAKVSFREPDCRFVNGQITGYQFVLTSPAEWAPGEVSNNVRENAVDLSGLIPYTEYTIKVWAENSVGAGPRANITFTTLPSVPPPPGNLTVYSASSEYLNVSWLPPYPPHGVLESYVIFYKLKEESHFRKNFSVSAHDAACEGVARLGQHCAHLHALMPKKEYNVLVVAKNKDVGEWSEASNIITAEPRESKSGPPSNVFQQDRREKEITITWNEPSLPNGLILGYRVVLVKRHSLSAENISIDVSPEVRQAQLDNLEAGTAYVAVVSAKTSAGYGEPVEIDVYTRPRIPVIETKVDVKTVDETAITLQLAPVDGEPEDIKAYYVLVERHGHGNRTKRSTDASNRAADGALHEWTGGTPDYNESVAMNLSFYMAAKMAPHEVRSGREFTVGDGLYYDGYYNAPLVPESTYSVGLATEVDFEGDSRISYRLLSDPITVGRQVPASGWSAPTAVIICVLILILAGILAVWKWRKQIIEKLPRSFPQKPAAPASDAASLSIMEENDGLDFEMEELSGSGSETTSKPLPLSDLQDYVQRMLACGGLKSEFTNLPKCLQQPTIEAQRTENKIKNRYRNVPAYDHSRVKLKPIPGVPCSDYINANYIDGYCRPKRYIATQGPNPHTVDDFWRMVWQENVCKIVMLTGLVENGKTRCEKYWPEKTATYGEIQVHFIAEETFPDYAVHQLYITLADTTREVKHFHLTSWPNDGVPLYPNTVLTFRRKVNQYRTFNEAAVVVHCSAGVGRTGAYILLDNLLEQAQAEGVVDVVGQLSAMRHSRMNVVKTLEQYNFVHRTLMESVWIRDHSVPCSKMYGRYRELLSIDETTGKSNMAKEFEELTSMKPWFTPTDFTAADDPANLRKSRDALVLAPDRCRPLLRNGTFVNTVYVNGFHKKDKFLVTQTPSSKDVDDLWKLVMESGARTIVTLDVFGDDADVVPFWPMAGSVKYGDYRVECIEDRQVNDMAVHSFKVTSKHKAPGSSGPVTVKHFHRTTWNSAEQMVDLVDHVERWQQQSDDRIILVQCRNGCFASGLFCCCALVLEKLKCEQEVDVFYATRIVRENRPQFISDCDQYKFCYDTAMAYLKSFKTYANFRQ